MAAWRGYELTDPPMVDDPTIPRDAANWHAIELLRHKLFAKFQWAKDFGVTEGNTYDRTTADAVGLFQGKVGLPVTGIANLATRARLGSYPPPAPPTHAALTVRGTGGIIGLDYTSQIALASPGHHEVPIDYAAAMGGIPVGAANDPSAPSGDECADQAEQMLTDWVMSTTATFSVFGYSLGCKGPVQFLNKLFDPAHPLYAHRGRLVCVVLVADPWRPFGHSFYMGPIPEGRGIGAPYFTMSDAAIAGLGWRCCWLANPADLYTNSPLGATGQVLADVEEIVLGTSVSDPLGTIGKVIPLLLKIIQKDGGLQSLLGGFAPILGGIAGGSTVLTAGLVTLLLPILGSAFQGLISGVSGNGSNLTPGVAADVQAAILALKFFGSGTAPHIGYHATNWGSGPQTFLQLGMQHANDWAGRVPVQA